MAEINDGGPAFPILQDGAQFPRAEGMTLRDYFAAQALPAIVDSYVKTNGRCIRNENFPRNVPLLAYQIADAMLRARKAHTQQDIESGLLKALGIVVNELAALIPSPSFPSEGEWPSSNSADRECMQKAYITARNALIEDRGQQ